MRSFQLASRSGQTARRQLVSRASRNVRYQSTTSPAGAGGGSGAVTGAAAGAASALVVGYTWYHFSGAKAAVQTANSTKSYVQSGVDKIKQSTPEPNEAIKYLRDAASSYSAFIPGAKGYVDGAFDQLDIIREKHGDEVDKIVRDAWTELQGIANQGGVDLATATKAWNVLQKHLKRVGKLAGEAANDIIEQNPKLKEKLGGSIDQLNQLGEQYGPEAKKQVDQTWDQIKDVVSGGISADTPEKIKKLVEDTKQKLIKAGDEAWTKGLEQAKPYLDKNPKAKELLENNADALKQGDVSQLWDTIKNNGDLGQLQEQVESQVNKVKSKGMGGLEQYVNMVPGGSQILPKLQLLQKAGQEHGKEAEQLLKETGEEIMQVLNKKADKAKQLLEDAKKTSSR